MQFFSFDTVDSTNDAARRLIAQGRIDGEAYVVAREQTAGRGTQGRSWRSPRDAGIYLTIVRLDAGQVTPDTTLHTLAAGVGCAEALSAMTGLEIRLKPINDLIAGGGKLGGILTEAFVENGRVSALLTGIGINVRRAARPIEEGAVEPSCLEALMPSSKFSALDISHVTQTIVEAVRDWQFRISDEGAEPVRRAWERMRYDA